MLPRGLTRKIDVVVCTTAGFAVFWNKRRKIERINSREKRMKILKKKFVATNFVLV